MEELFCGFHKSGMCLVCPLLDKDSDPAFDLEKDREPIGNLAILHLAANRYETGSVKHRGDKPAPFSQRGAV